MDNYQIIIKNKTINIFIEELKENKILFIIKIYKKRSGNEVGINLER